MDNITTPEELAQAFKQDIIDTLLRNTMSDVILQSWALMLGGAVTEYEKMDCCGTVINDSNNYLTLEHDITKDDVKINTTAANTLSTHVLTDNALKCISEVRRIWICEMQQLLLRNCKMVTGTVRFHLQRTPSDWALRDNLRLSMIYGYAEIPDKEEKEEKDK